MDFHNLSIKETYKKFNTSSHGLTENEAKKRLGKFGVNKLPEEKRLTRLEIFIDQLKNPLVYVLLIAALISFFLNKITDMGVILAAVIINTIVGFIQENKVNKALSKLKKMVEYKALVMRGGKEKKVDVRQIVPGDIILIESGDKIPADSRLIEINDLGVSEAPLTGESLPADKTIEILDKDTPLPDRENMVYMSTEVIKGKGRAVVCATGINTQLGEVALLVSKTKEDKTPLQKKLISFSKLLSIFILGISLLILLVGISTGKSFADMFLISVAVAVAAIPEGLVVAVTVILAIGMQRILKKKALVRKLIAAETLGSTTIICSDKTGTLTEGVMKVDKVLTEDKENHILALKIGMLCNNSIVENPDKSPKKWMVLGSPTEKALILAGGEAGHKKRDLEKRTPRLDEIPFDSDVKYMATLHQSSEINNIIYFKGAPEVIISFSSFIYINDTNDTEKTLDNIQKEKLKEQYEKLTKKGLRVLAVAYKKIPANIKSFKNYENPFSDLVFVGFFALRDPLRKEAKKTIELCKKSGLRPIIVTGDHKLTAKNIAEEVGISAQEKNILEGKDLDKLTDSELKNKVEDINIYARVSPKHKLRIVDAWQEKGEVVAMTGDGVNDAPALKSADIGIALGSGTDVAKETSDMILLDNNFATIVSAIEQGRVIFDNIKKVVLYLLSDSFSEVFIILASLFLGLPLPLLAPQILWINLVTDGFPDISLTMEPEEVEVMSEPPKKSKAPILDLEMKVLIFLISFITGIGTLGIFYWIFKTTGDIEKARTVAFVSLGIDSLLYVFSCRSLRHSILQKNIFSNKYLLAACAAGAFLQLAAIYTPFLQKILSTVPLGWPEWKIILLVSLLVIVAIEITKWIFILRKEAIKNRAQ